MRFLLTLPAVSMALAVLAVSGCSSGDDNADARVRLLNVSPGYKALDLYVTDEDSDTDELRSSNIVFGALGEYTQVDSGTYDIQFKKSGVTSTLLELPEKKLADESNATYVAVGALGRFSYVELNEDVEEPDDEGRSKIQVINGTEAGTLDVYLTDSDVPLQDASPLVSLEAKTGSAVQTQNRGDYRLRVTGPNDIADLRLDVPNITLENKQVAALILSESSGGVLVEASMLPQQGSLTQYTNTKARVRGAVGINSGSVATLRIGDTTILNTQSASVISTYSQVEAGSVPVFLLIDGNPVPVENQTLAAGADYTMLLWSDAAGSHATLIADDNHLPTDTTDAKIRLLNGYSAQGVPLTLSVNFFPVAQGTALGTASSYTEVDAGTDIPLDVNNTTNAADVTSRESDLQASGVYTLLVVSAADGTATATIRKDR
jgi:hypothetical protein